MYNTYHQAPSFWTSDNISLPRCLHLRLRQNVLCCHFCIIKYLTNVYRYQNNGRLDITLEHMFRNVQLSYDWLLRYIPLLRYIVLNIYTRPWPYLLWGNGNHRIVPFLIWCAFVIKKACVWRDDFHLTVCWQIKYVAISCT